MHLIICQSLLDQFPYFKTKKLDFPDATVSKIRIGYLLVFKSFKVKALAEPSFSVAIIT